MFILKSILIKLTPILNYFINKHEYLIFVQKALLINCCYKEFDFYYDNFIYLPIIDGV